jgi:hypothetical protein
MANSRTPEEAEKQIGLLVEENRKLGAELEELRGQCKALSEAVRRAAGAQASAEKELAALRVKFETAQKKLTELEEANETLTAQVGRLNLQVEKNPLNPLTVEEASRLFEQVVGAFRKSRTLQVRDASLNLKLATAKIGTTPLLLLPEPKAIDPSLLHELKLNLTSVASAEPIVESKAPSAAPQPRRAPRTAAAPPGKKAAGRTRTK